MKQAWIELGLVFLRFEHNIESNNERYMMMIILTLFFSQHLTVQQHSKRAQRNGNVFLLLCDRKNLPSGCGFSGAQQSCEFTHVREMIIFVYYIFPLPISHDVSLLTVRMHTMLQQPSCWIKSECELQLARNFLCNNLDSILTGFFQLLLWSTRSFISINHGFNLKFELNWAAHAVNFKSHQRFAINKKHSVLAYLHHSKKCRPNTLIIVISEKEHREILSEIMSYPLTATTNKTSHHTQNSHAANHLQIAPVRLNYLRYRAWFVDLLSDNPPADIQIYASVDSRKKMNFNNNKVVRRPLSREQGIATIKCRTDEFCDYH